MRKIGKRIRFLGALPAEYRGCSTRTAKDGSGSIQQRCFVHGQNSPSTVVHGCTTVEDDSNGLTAFVFCDIASIHLMRLPLLE